MRRQQRIQIDPLRFQGSILSNETIDTSASSATPIMAAMRGDRVEIVVDVGNGVQTYEIEATRAGRRVEVSTGRGIVEVSEVTRGGKAVRTGRFMTARVVALVEHPAEAEPTVGSPRSRRAAGRGQSSLL
jgi:hypothetical protein